MNFVIAKTMLKHINQIPEISIKEMAYLANTSVASVSKFCKELNYESFKDLRCDNYIFDQNTYFQYLIDQSGSLPVETIYSNFQRNIDEYELKMLSEFDQYLLKQVANYIKDSKNIAIYTGLHGYAATNLLNSLLLQYDIQSFRVNRKSDPTVIKAINDEADAIIVISLTGKWIDSQIKNSGFNASSLKKTILITHEDTLRFENLCRFVISFNKTKDFFSSTYISDRLMKAFVFHLIIHLSKTS